MEYILFKISMDTIWGEKTVRMGDKSDHKCYLWVIFSHFSTNFRLFDGLSKPLSLKTYHILPLYVFMQSLHHVT